MMAPRKLLLVLYSERSKICSPTAPRPNGERGGGRGKAEVGRGRDVVYVRPREGEKLGYEGTNKRERWKRKEGVEGGGERDRGGRERSRG
eukprot:scaffold52599_cov37-Tisochrysis_lutea.AAC.2